MKNDKYLRDRYGNAVGLKGPSAQEKAIKGLQLCPIVNGKRIIQPMRNRCGYGI